MEANRDRELIKELLDALKMMVERSKWKPNGDLARGDAILQAELAIDKAEWIRMQEESEGKTYPE
jgi:hypothetical protein